jgi:hypothetical protein
MRPSGNVLNGSAFDPTISGAGTNYTQQDVAQLSLSDLAATQNSTTIISVTGGFTAAMIGNAIRIAASSNFILGYYFVTGYTNTNTITVDRAPCTAGIGTGGSGKLGGANTLNSGAWPEFVNGSAAAGVKMVAGNTLYIYGSGSRIGITDTVTYDYLFSSYYASAITGDSTNGFIHFIGENGTPRFKYIGAPLVFYGTLNSWIENIDILLGEGTYGAFYSTGPIILNCRVNVNGFNSIGIQSSSGVVMSCEVYGGASPSGTSAGITGGGLGCFLEGNYVHNVAGVGIDAADATSTVINNLIVSPGSHGINYSFSNYPGVIANNTIVSPGGHGINITTQVALLTSRTINNFIANVTGAGKYGIAVGTGTTVANDRIAGIIKYNAYYNCTNGISLNFSGGSNNVIVGADPFVSAITGNYSLNANNPGGAQVKAMANPGLFPGNAQLTKSYLDIGAVQHADTSASANIIRSHIIQRIR